MKTLTFLSLFSASLSASMGTQDSQLVWAHLDGDDRPDLLALDFRGGASLQLNRGAGLFDDVTAGSGLETLAPGRAAAWEDWDRDGIVDLTWLDVDGSLHLLRGLDGLRFEELPAVADQVPGALESFRWIDFDGVTPRVLELRATGGAWLLRVFEDGALELLDLGFSVQDAPDGLSTAVATTSLDPDQSNGTSTSQRSAPGRSSLGSSQGTPSGSPGGSAESNEVGCAMSLADLAGGGCLTASSVPTLGSLYPLSFDWNVAPSGHVGVGVASPSKARLHVGELDGGGVARAVFAETTSAWANSVLGEAHGTGARAVFGIAKSTSGINRGVAGQSNSSEGLAVSAVATATSGQSYGVHAESWSSQGTAVYGSATAASGTTYAVRGDAQSPNGWAGYFEGRGHFEGAVGIGTTAPTAKLDVAGTVRTDALRLPTGAQDGYVLQSDASGNASWQPPASGGGGGGVSGAGTAGSIARFDSAGSIADSNLTEVAGSLGLGTAAPTAGLHVRSGSQEMVGGFPELYTVGTSSMRLEGTHLGDGTGATLRFGAQGNPDVYLRDDAEHRLEIVAEEGIVLGGNNAESRVGIGTYDMTHAFNVQAGTDNRALRLRGAGSSGVGARLSFGDGDSVVLREDFDDHLQVEAAKGVKIASTATNANSLIAQSFGGNGAGTASVYSVNLNQGDGVAMYARSEGVGSTMVLSHYGTGDLLQAFGAGDLTPSFRIRNNGHVVSNAFEITGGADIVEGFEATAPCEPGTVVVLDPEVEGSVRPSSEPYDGRVMGIASGAGGVRPGLSLRQEGVLEGETQVALLGRVYVKCSAENGPIEPGDLLTTSRTVGHAMRASDPSKSFGAVIGKALGSLDEGTGLVLVVVSLQ